VIVVSDASPLISLAATGQLNLLRHLYAEVVIPVAVHREITVSPDASGAVALKAAAWIRVQAVQNHTLVEALSLSVDPGEAEAIALAVETEAELLLMDERRGRGAATRMGRRVVGVLGVLIEAKQHGHLSTVRPVLDSLIEKVGFRVSDVLKERVLAAAGE
jgi:predicted nucleic acid-binding protein